MCINTHNNIIWFTGSNANNFGSDCNCDISETLGDCDIGFDCDCNCACETTLSVDAHKTGELVADMVQSNQLSSMRLDNEHYILWNADQPIRGINVVNSQMFKNLQKNTHFKTSKALNLLLNRDIMSLKESKEYFKQEDTKVFASWLHLSNKCNFACSYCYLKKSAINMPLAIGLKSVRSIFNTAVKNNIKEVKIKYAGAEALYNFPVAEKVQQLALQLAEEHQIKLSSTLLTNATLLNDATISKLQKLKFRVMVSIDGIGEYHDYYRSYKNGKSSYNTVMSNTAKLKQAGILSDVSITVTDKNIKGLPDLVEILLEKDYPFNINFYRENENTVNRQLSLSEKEIIKYMKATFKVIENNLPRRCLLPSLLDRVNLLTPHDYTCGIGRNYAVIDHQGHLSKCQMEIGKNKTFATIDSEDLLSEIKNDNTQLQNMSVNDKADCRKCEIKRYCTGGCPITSGTQKSPNCNIYKSLFRDVLRLEALRILKYEQPHILN